MKNLLSFIGTLAIIAFQSIVVSAFFTLCKWLLSLLGLCNAPTWFNFVGGAAILFSVLFLYSVGNTCITLYRYNKDPVFKEANLKVGLSWKDYKALKKQKPVYSKKPNAIPIEKDEVLSSYMVKGVPSHYVDSMELLMINKNGVKRHAIVVCHVRKENKEYVVDNESDIVSYMLDGEVIYEHVSTLNEKVVGYEPISHIKKDVLLSAKYSIGDKIILPMEDGGNAVGTIVSTENELYIIHFPYAVSLIDKEEPEGGWSDNDWPKTELEITDDVIDAIKEGYYIGTTCHYHF